MSKYLTVSAINKYLKHVIDNDEHLQDVYIKGEISNFKAHGTGHLYFSLKDDSGRINAIMFKFNVAKMKFKPVDGMKVLVQGKISVYEATGNYQVYVNEMLEDGLGNLHIAYEQLKKQLLEEGLFDQDKKKPLVKIPKKVGIITAPTGAAIRDIVSTIKRRWPLCEIFLFPALVQGDGAKEDIVKRIMQANEYDLDTLIIGRGGGSIEDLWAFNEEIVARAIAESNVPIISAVGHETDTTIADYVADLRAATPTAAAEIAVPDQVEMKSKINFLKSKTLKAYTGIVEMYGLKLKRLKDSFVLKNVSAIYEPKFERINLLIEKSSTIMQTKLNLAGLNCDRIKEKLVQLSPLQTFYETKLEKVKYLTDRCFGLIEVKLNLATLNAQKMIEKLILLNPLQTLGRGYAVVHFDNKIVRSIKDVSVANELEIMVMDGTINTKVISMEENDEV